MSDTPVLFNAAALDQLKKAIEGTGIGPENFAWPPHSDPLRSPYRGWEPFEDIDAAVFFGRDAAIMRGTEELRKMRFSGVKSLFVVLGPSGSGKSSFLRAGLIPRLQRDDRNFVVLGTVRPGRNAITGERGLAAAIHSACHALKLPNSPPLGEIKKICRDRDHERVRELLVGVRTAAAERQARIVTGKSARTAAAPTLVLPLDQAEELFAAESASAQAAQEADGFLELLTAVIGTLNADDVGLIVAATIRTDRYEAMQNHPALDGIGTELFNELKTMPHHQFPAAITGPATRASEAGNRLAIADDLVDRLVAEAGAGADTLPLLALTLQRLYTDYGTAEEITLDDYESMGGMPNVVNNQIEEILAEGYRDYDAALELLRAAFIPWLASINPDNDRPMRRVALQSELPAESRKLIDAFVEKRLLVRDRRNSEVVLEVGLESLLRQWDHLVEWLQEERHSLVVAADLERATAAWKRNGRDESWLLEGARLATAETVSAKPGFAERLGPATEFLVASRQRQAGRLEAEQQRFRDLVARRLIAEAKAMMAQTIPGGDARAFQQLLAARAISSEPDVAPIAEALALRPRARKIINAGQPLLGVAFSPDGARLAAAGDDKTVWIWDTASGELAGAPLTGHTSRVYDVAFSPDGGRLASAGGDKTVRVWNAATGQQIGTPCLGHTGVVYGVAVSPDGQRLASAGGDKTVRLWDAATGQQIGEPLLAHAETVWAVKFSPDGQRLVSGSRDQTVRLWDAVSGEPLGEPLAGHTSVVCDVAFSPDGARVASASYDGTLRIWDADGEVLIGHTDAVHGVAFSPDGQRLASASQDHTVRLWDAVDGRAPDGGAEALCATLTANMSAEQWSVWVSPDIE